MKILQTYFTYYLVLVDFKLSSHIYYKVFICFAGINTFVLICIHSFKKIKWKKCCEIECRWNRTPSFLSYRPFTQTMQKPGFKQIILPGLGQMETLWLTAFLFLLLLLILDGTILLIPNNFALSRCSTVEWKKQRIHSRETVWVQVPLLTSYATVGRLLNFYSLTCQTRTIAIPTLKDCYEITHMKVFYKL